MLVDLGQKSKMRHKVISARITGMAVTFAIFFGGLWCSTNLRENGVTTRGRGISLSLFNSDEEFWRYLCIWLD